MKFVDKFALVPIDRYNQLIKHLNADKVNADKGDTDSTDIDEKQLGAGEQVVKENFGKKTETSEHSAGYSNIDNIRSSVDVKDNKLDSLHKPVNTKIKQKKLKKIKPPPLPPGIPNKPSKNRFRWVSLF
jgi:uncharacterized protein related to proFAR isomerase